MIGKKVCPSCESEEVQPLGGLTGGWMCKECGYSGAIFPEIPLVGAGKDIKEIIDRQHPEDKKKSRSKK